MTIAPIRRSVVVKAPPARAFAAFTTGMAGWWPKTHTIAEHPFVEIIMEPYTGGRWFERAANGDETQWGKVLTWEPPDRVVLAWQIDATWKYDPELVTEVELAFVAQADGGALVRFEHRNLERFGPSAQDMVAMLSGGWLGILDGFAIFASTDESQETAQ